MKYSKATNYALHVVQLLYKNGDEKAISVSKIAAELQVAPSYLSKILANLVKQGILEAISGANGGYRINALHARITMLDVIHAIEGSQSMFECDPMHGPSCTIYQKMKESETQMETFLSSIYISDLV